MIDVAVSADGIARAPATARDALVDALADIEAFVAGIRTDLYAAGRPATTVGGHVARCVARIESLLRGADAGAITYSPAARDIAVDPVAALKKIRTLRIAISAWPRAPLSSVVRTLHAAAPDDDAEGAWSTLEAETAFVVSETVDAQRLIAATLRSLGAPIPNGFGDSQPPPLTARSSTPPVWALWKRLDEIAALLLAIPAAAYTAPVEGHISGTLGAHVRHCLDHIAALVGSEPSKILSYDRRRRGTAIEADRSAALEHILRLKAALECWSARSLDEAVRVASQIDASGGAIVGWSTLGRELAFVLSHTIHHQATMAAVLALHGVGSPDGFGFAPSTPRH